MLNWKQEFNEIMPAEQWDPMLVSPPWIPE